MTISWRRFAYYLAVTSISTGLILIITGAEQYSRLDRESAEAMLQNVASDVKNYYYDPQLHGVNWDERVNETKIKVDSAQSLNVAMSEIAALLDGLNDSHTFLLPPPSTHIHDYGFQMEMVGDRCYVVRVRPGSDAEKKGLKAGDQILSVNGNKVTRSIFWKLIYIFNVLRPQLALQLATASDAGERHLEVTARFQLSTTNAYFLQQGINQRRQDADEIQRNLRARYFEKGDSLLVIRIPKFAFSDSEVDNITSRMRAHRAVILDLRGNPGGYVETLDRLLGGIFENDVKLCDRVERNSTKTIFVKGRHRESFTGKLAVLVDSESASASEVFARVVQLEKRGVIVGDQSSGRVMEAKLHPHEFSVNTRVYYALYVTHADVMMSDGKSLEHVGVTPDVLALPAAKDLASRRDPVMAKAADLIGAQLSPEEAGTVPQYEESKEFSSTLSLND